MFRLSYILGLSVLISTSSCVLNKTLTSTVKPNEIKNLAYFEPLSYIQLIEKGNKSKLNDSLSIENKTLLKSIILKHKKKYHFSKEIEIESEITNVKLENEINYLMQMASRNRSLNGLKLTPTIDSIMQINNQRFALAIISVGFGRRKGNYSGQVAKGVGIGILTLGMYAPIPIKSNLTLYGMIFDSERNDIAFFKYTKPVEKSPTEKIIIEKQLYKLLNGYFYNQK